MPNDFLFPLFSLRKLNLKTITGISLYMCAFFSRDFKKFILA